MLLGGEFSPLPQKQAGRFWLFSNSKFTVQFSTGLLNRNSLEYQLPLPGEKSIYSLFLIKKSQEGGENSIISKACLINSNRKSSSGSNKLNSLKLHTVEKCHSSSSFCSWEGVAVWKKEGKKDVDDGSCFKGDSNRG